MSEEQTEEQAESPDDQEKDTSQQSEENAQESTAKPTEEPEPEVVIDGTKRVLVVEDTGALRRILVKYLKMADYDTLEAENGKEALKLLIKSKSNIDVILLDIMMPLMDGMTFLKRIRNSADYEKMPVIMLTSKSERSVVLDTLRAGANDFIIKPFTYDIIIDKVQKIIGVSAPADVKVGVNHTVTEVDFGNVKSPREKVDILIQRVRTLLALPFSVVQISRMCGQEDTSAKDLVKPIQSDPAVAALVLTRANSAAFGGSRSIQDIKEAVVRIGMKETRNIAVTFSVMKLFSKGESDKGFNKSNFWVHSLSTGICAQLLAKHLGLENPEDAFLAGLLHDIGKMVLDDFLNEEYARVVQRQKSGSRLMKDAETSVFEVNHAYVGGMVVDRWGFPRDIGDAILDHHKNDRFKPGVDPMPIAFVVNMADQLTKALQLGSGGDSKIEIATLPLWSELDNKPLKISDFLVNMMKEIEDFISLLKVEEKCVDLELPEEEKGFVIWADINGADNPSGYERLLEIALQRYGYQMKCITEVDDAIEQGKEAVAVIANLTKLEEGVFEEVSMKFKNGCEKLIAIYPNEFGGDSSTLKLPLDFDDLISELIV